MGSIKKLKEGQRTIKFCALFMKMKSGVSLARRATTVKKLATISVLALLSVHLSVNPTKKNVRMALIQEDVGVEKYAYPKELIKMEILVRHIVHQYVHNRKCCVEVPATPMAANLPIFALKKWKLWVRVHVSNVVLQYVSTKCVNFMVDLMSMDVNCRINVLKLIFTDMVAVCMMAR